MKTKINPHLLSLPKENQNMKKNIPQHSVDLKMINDECTNLVRIVRIFNFFLVKKIPNLEEAEID